MVKYILDEIALAAQASNAEPEMDFWRLARIASVSALILLNQLSLSNAQDATFPCKVLLCAAATNPSWTAIPYCVPIMQQALYMQAWGIAVGACAAAQNSSPGTGGASGSGVAQNSQ